MSATDERLWSAEDLMHFAGVSRRTVGGWCRNRRIPFLKLGRTIRFRPEAVRTALAKFEVREVTR
jgi:excisionase family DNA binding protein